MTIAELTDSLQRVAHRAQFISFIYKTKEKTNKAGQVIDGGEISRYTLIAGANYFSTLEKSLLAVQLFNPADLKEAFNPEFLAQAIAEVKESLEKSISFQSQGQQNPDYTKKGLYRNLGAGINVNENDNTIQFFGLIHSKVVLQPGIRKPVNSAPLTIVKNQIRKLLPIGKFREFALDAGNIQTVKMQGETLIVE